MSFTEKMIPKQEDLGLPSLFIDNDILRDAFNRVKYKPIKFGKYSLSIQAGSGIYSCPRKNVPLSEYTCFEVAIFLDGQDKWPHPLDIDGFPDDIAQKWEPPMEGFNSNVGPYIEKRDVQRIVDFFEENFAS